MTQAATKKNLLPQVAGAAVWAVFFIFAPFIEFIVLGAILWLPFFIWCERRRTARYGFLPGAARRFGIIVLSVTLAALAPTKHEDGRVGPLQSTSVTLAELVAARVIYPLSDSQFDGLHVTVPSLTPTRRQVMRAISEQTGLRASIFHCGNAATVLFGSGGGLIRVSGETTQPRPNPYEMCQVSV